MRIEPDLPSPMLSPVGQLWTVLTCLSRCTDYRTEQFEGVVSCECFPSIIESIRRSEQISVESESNRSTQSRYSNRNNQTERSAWLGIVTHEQTCRHDNVTRRITENRSVRDVHRHFGWPIWESSSTFRFETEALDQLLSSIDVSEEFRNRLEFLLSESSVINAENYSETECYYMRILAQRRQLTIRWKKDWAFFVKEIDLF